MIPLFKSSGHRLLIGGLIAASLVPVWVVEYFPSQNGPWSLLMAKMLSDYNNPTFNYSTYYTPSWHAIPHLLHTLLVYGLSFVLPIVIAHKVAISLSVVLLPLSVFAFLASVDPRRTVFGYASFLFVYNVPLLRGYHDYALGIPLVLLTYAYWRVRRDTLTVLTRLTLMGMTVLVYLSHAFNLAVLGLAIVLTTAWERRDRWAVLNAASLFVIPFVMALEYAWFTATEAQWLDRSEIEFLTPLTAAEAFFSRFFFTVSVPAYVVAIVVLLAWSALLLLGLLHTWQHRRGGEIGEWTLPLLLAVLTALYFAAPYKFLSWHYVNARFIPYVLVFALGCALPLGKRGRRVFIGSIVGAALVCYGFVMQGFIRADHMIQEYVSGVNVVEKNTTLLPVRFSGENVGDISPVAHAADYYQVFRGGANGDGMAQFNTITPLVYRASPLRSQFPSWRSGPEAVRQAYDYVLLWDDPGVVTHEYTAEGFFEVAHQEGRLRILRNTRLRSEGAAAAAAIVRKDLDEIHGR